VIDNVEELIASETSDFCKLLEMLLNYVSQMKILMTSRRKLVSVTFPFKQELIILE